MYLRFEGVGSEKKKTCTGVGLHRLHAPARSGIFKRLIRRTEETHLRHIQRSLQPRALDRESPTSLLHVPYSCTRAQQWQYLGTRLEPSTKRILTGFVSQQQKKIVLVTFVNKTTSSEGATPPPPQDAPDRMYPWYMPCLRKSAASLCPHAPSAINPRKNMAPSMLPALLSSAFPACLSRRHPNTIYLTHKPELNQEVFIYRAINESIMPPHTPWFCCPWIDRTSSPYQENGKKTTR